MKNIALHKIDFLEAFKDDYAWRKNKFEQYISKTKQEFKFLYFLYRDSLVLLEQDNMLKLDHANSNKYFRYSLNSISEFCRLAHFPGEKKEAQIDESGAFFIKIEDYAHPEDLIAMLNSIFISIIARDKEKQKIIASAPLSFFGIKKDDNSYFICLVKIFIEYINTGIFNEELYTLMKIDFNKISADVKPDPKSKFHVYFIDKYMTAFKSLTDNNEAEFNQNLIKALEAHKAVWGQKKALNRGGTPLCRENEGFLSWGCTALAAIAYDKGWKLEVESDYMPPFMVDGSINQ